MQSFDLGGASAFLDQLPTYQEILQEAKEGEVQFLWQIRAEADRDCNWLNLPSVISRAVDREFAKWVTTSSCGSAVNRPKIVCFAFHINFQQEMPYSWVASKCIVLSNGARRIRKPRKQFAVVNFNRETLELQICEGEWAKVRCVRVTYDKPAEVLVEASLEDLLRDRLAVYGDSDAEEEEKEDLVANAAEEAADAAEAEGFNMEIPAPLGDGHQDEVDEKDIEKDMGPFFFSRNLAG